MIDPVGGDTPEIRLLVPDLPTAAELAPWLERIDDHRWYSNFGPLVREFESAIARHLTPGTDAPPAHVVSVASATAGLETVLAALALPRPARVLVPALTFPATVTAVCRLGHEPLLGDVDEASWALTPTLARQVAACTRVDAVVPVAAFGHPQPVADWDAFAADTGIPVVVDAAAAFGVQGVGRRVHVVYSFHATKAFGIGEGGAIATPDGDFAMRSRALTNFGFGNWVIATPGGSNAKLSEYHAAVGLAQLARWNAVADRRLELARLFLAELRACACPVSLQEGWGESVAATLVVALPHRSDAGRAMEALATAGIETRRWYCPPLYEHPAFRDLERVAPAGGDALPITSSLATRLLGLPFHTRLSVDDVRQVCRRLASHLVESAAEARP